MKTKAYEAIVEWEHTTLTGHTYTEREIVDVEATSLANAHDEVVRKLESDYEPGGKIVTVSDYVPRIHMWSWVTS